MSAMGYEQIGSIEELRDLLGVPTGRAVTKERTTLHAMDTEWLAVSPYYYAPANYSRRLY